MYSVTPPRTGWPGINGGVEREWPPSPCRPRCRRSTVTSVIVQVADSVTESSSGKFITETPQTSGTGPLPAGRRRTGLGQAALCPPTRPRPCSPLLFSPLLARSVHTSSSSFPSGWGRFGCLCRVSLISLSFNAVARCKTVTLLPFDPWLRGLLLGAIHQLTHIWKAGTSTFLCFMHLLWPVWTLPHSFTSRI